ncbi:hypothetical protein EAH87_14850 [Sphingomonas koreensis]|nr:hypothetical protein EAH87_14850 [Sphingomonas koreensis]
MAGTYSCAAIGMLTAFGGAIGTPAAAQDISRTDSVTSRENARVEDTSLQLGAFLVNPELTATGVYDDNVFATKDDRRGDTYVQLRPEVTAQSTWDRNSLNLNAYYERDFHATYPGEDTTNYGVLADGRYDVSHQTRLYATVDAERTAEQRGSLSSFFNAAQPVEYNSITLTGAGEQEFGNLKLRAEGRYRRLSYADAVLANGDTLNQSFRNFGVVDETLQAGYNLNTLTQFLIRGTLEQRRYDRRRGDPGFDPLTQLDRSGNSSRLEVGVVRELTALLYGTVRIGYLSFRYPDPKLRDVSALSYYGDLKWNITPLTTINATAVRQVDETVSPVTAGNLRDQFTLKVDHELLPALIVSASGRYASIHPSVVDSDTTAISADSQEEELELEARYYIGRHLRVTGHYDHQSRSSANKFIAYSANLISVGLNYQF